jgi:uncharacterized protein (DUF1810 family)
MKPIPSLAEIDQQLRGRRLRPLHRRRGGHAPVFDLTEERGSLPRRGTGNRTPTAGPVGTGQTVAVTSSANGSEMSTDDPYDLNRFVAAQNTDGIYGLAVEELSCGRKISHWMWFVFPQIAGLGYSATSKRFAISSVDEARAFLDHPVLGPRLIECTGIVGKLQGLSAEQIFGSIDARKLHSSMTLFMRASRDEPYFKQVLHLYFDGQPDAATNRLLIA